jgi:hypothetical protein
LNPTSRKFKESTNLNAFRDRSCQKSLRASYSFIKMNIIIA